MAGTGGHPWRPVLVVLGQAPPGLDQVTEQAQVRFCTDETLPEALPGADALFVWDFTSGAVERAWPAADRLRWIHMASAGVDTLMFDELRHSEVVVTNSRGVFDEAIAEYVLTLVLSFAKDIATTVRDQAAVRWQHRETERIAGKRVLVVGTGPIGRAVARLLRAVGMKVAGIGRTRRQDPDFGRVDASTDLLARLPWADYVVCAAPLTDQTRGMFGTAAFRAMRPTARFINVGRGAHVVTRELEVALRDGVIAGAALDVVDTEPLPRESALWSMPNVVVSPHMSGDVAGWESALVTVFEDNLQRWITGERLRNVVDKQLGYPSGRDNQSERVKGRA